MHHLAAEIPLQERGKIIKGDFLEVFGELSRGCPVYPEINSILKVPSGQFSILELQESCKKIVANRYEGANVLHLLEHTWE